MDTSKIPDFIASPRDVLASTENSDHVLYMREERDPVGECDLDRCHPEWSVCHEDADELGLGESYSGSGCVSCKDRSFARSTDKWSTLARASFSC